MGFTFNKGKMRRVRRIAISVIFILLLLVGMMPTVSAADTAVAQSADGSSYYYSVSDAWTAAKSGVKIVLLQDWKLSEPLNVPDSYTVTIEMNGKKIYQDLDETSWDGDYLFEMEENATLNILGEKTTAEFTYYGCTSSGGSHTENPLTVKSGGLLTSGYVAGGTNKDSYGIKMKANCNLTLKGVALAGTYKSAYGAGIYVDGKDCTIKLENAILTGNAASRGAAIYINKSNCKIYMDKTTISDNYAKDYGGAIFSDANDTHIYMTNGSKFVNNTATSYNTSDKGQGGAIYFNYTDFTVESSDKTGVFSGNVATTQGGAIYICQKVFGSNSGTISGLTFTENKGTGEKSKDTDGGGGAIYIEQENITIKNCTFTNNSSEYGGAIEIENDDTTISDCVITNNTVSDQAGGVYATAKVDLTLSGKVIIKDNYCTDGSRDDVYLASGITKAYIIGTPSAGSLVGIKTKDSDERQVGKKQTSTQKGIYFSDIEGCKIEYRSSNELYQVSGDEYTVKVNGVTTGVYEKGAKVVADGTSTDVNKIFKTWKSVTDGVTLDSKDNAVAVFTMPAKSVILTAEYIDSIVEVTLNVNQPQANKYLPESGSITLVDSQGKKTVIDDVPIIWAEGTGDSAQTVSGKAQYGKKYYAIASLDRDPDNNIIFSKNLKAENVHVQYKHVSGDKLGGFKVDDSGNLIIYGAAIKTDNATVQNVTDVDITVDAATREELLSQVKSLIPDTAEVETNNKEKTTLEVDKDQADYSNIDSVIDSEGDVEDGSFTVTIPLKATDSIDVTDSQQLTVNVTVESTAEKKTVTEKPEIDLKPGTYEGESLSLKLSCATAGAKLYYQVDNGVTTEYVDGITLTGEEGSKLSHIVTVWAKGPDSSYVDSAKVTATYVLDNPYTVTVTGKDTGLKQNDDLWETPKTYKYYKGDKVTIAAPVVSDEIFEKWENATGITIDDPSKNTLTIDSLSGNVSLTAVYNPVIKSISVNLTEPTGGEKLATSIDSASVTITNTFDDTAEYFNDIEWIPNDDTASYGKAYTAKLTLNDAAYSSNMKFLLAENIAIKVNDGKSDATARIVEENGKYIMYVIFPATDKLNLVEVVNPTDMTFTRDEVSEKGWTKNLPVYTTIKLSDGSEVSVDIKWTDIPDFDLDGEEAQTLTVTGEIGLPEYVNDVDGFDTVQVTMNIAIPAKEEPDPEPDPDPQPQPDPVNPDDFDVDPLPKTSDLNHPLGAGLATCVSGALVVLAVYKRRKNESR